MAEPKVVVAQPKKRSKRPALTPEARERQLVSLATDLAERQLMEGTASSQVITHYLKLGSVREKLEREKLIAENELARAKRESLQSEARMEEIYKSAMNAMSIYNGKRATDDEED